MAHLACFFQSFSTSSSFFTIEKFKNVEKSENILDANLLNPKETIDALERHPPRSLLVGESARPGCIAHCRAETKNVGYGFCCNRKHSGKLDRVGNYAALVDVMNNTRQTPTSFALATYLTFSTPIRSGGEG